MSTCSGKNCLPRVCSSLTGSSWRDPRRARETSSRATTMTLSKSQGPELPRNYTIFHSRSFPFFFFAHSMIPFLSRSLPFSPLPKHSNLVHTMANLHSRKRVNEQHGTERRKRRQDEQAERERERERTRRNRLDPPRGLLTGLDLLLVLPHPRLTRGAPSRRRDLSRPDVRPRRDRERRRHRLRDPRASLTARGGSTLDLLRLHGALRRLERRTAEPRVRGRPFVLDLAVDERL